MFGLRRGAQTPAGLAAKDPIRRTLRTGSARIARAHSGLAPSEGPSRSDRRSGPGRASKEFAVNPPRATQAVVQHRRLVGDHRVNWVEHLPFFNAELGRK